ncbi:MAG TPA: hypothetical protein VF974_02970 [Patescibacteria group bacterium]
MLDQSLLEYVKKTLAQGLSADVITQTLRANGWAEDSIKEAMVMASMPGVPQAPGFTPPPSAVAETHAQPQSIKPKRNYAIYSQYSILLAFVLFFGLLILANKAVSDVGRQFGSDVTGRLIAQTFLILPFLIVAFIFHFGLNEQGEKYQILSRPYYIVAAWLLISLLFSVSEYILSSQVVYGVYIVLLLVVAVLTVGILFVQKFIRHKN